MRNFSATFALLLHLLVSSVFAREVVPHKQLQLVEGTTWKIQVADQTRARFLRFGRTTLPNGGTHRVEAWFGGNIKNLKPVEVSIADSYGFLSLRFLTSTNGVIEIELTSPSTLEGTLTSEKGQLLELRFVRTDRTEPKANASGMAIQKSTPLDKVHLIYMGGNDCPPCRYWLSHDLPQLNQAETFQRIKFSKVNKTIPSAVPPIVFLPDDVRPLKSQLDTANGGTGGSPQVALFVDGRLFDYYFATRTADEVLQMLRAIETGGTYPFPRCLQITTGGFCVRQAQ